MANAVTQRSTLDVGAGLYVLRYLGSMDVRNAPTAHVAPLNSSRDDIDVIVAPGGEAGELTHPGSSLVLVVRKAGGIDVVVRATENSDNVDARLTLDLLASPAIPAPRFARSTGPGRGKADFPRSEDGTALISIQAHVARRGDVTADEDGWIAGPNAPAAIEGLRIECADPQLGIVGQFRNTQSREWSRWSQPGDFIGTEQKASPLIGLRLRLSGASAVHHELEVRSLFLGSPMQHQRGTEIEVLSPGDLDPLVGFNVKLVTAGVSKQIEDKKPPRVRVFR